MSTPFRTGIRCGPIAQVGRLTVGDGASPSVTNLALSGAYLYGTSGPAMAVLFLVPESANLTDFWFSAAAFANWGSTDGTIRWEVREGLNGNYKPYTLVSSGTITLAGTEIDTWIHVSGLSVALTAGKSYSITLGDPDGTASNYVTLHQFASGTNVSLVGGYANTTDGFQTAAGGTSPTLMAWKVGGQMFGGLITSAASTTSSTRRRGNRIQFSETVTMVAISNFVSGIAANITSGYNFEIFASGAMPGDTPLWTYTPPTSGLAATMHWRVMPLPASAFFEFKKNVQYIFTLRPALVASPSVYKYSSYAGMDSDLRSLLSGFAGVAVSYVAENVGGTWDEDADAMSDPAPVFLSRSTPTVIG